MENAINGRIKEENQIDIPEEQELIQTPIIMKYMLLDPDYSNRNDNLEQTIYRRYKRNKDNFEKGETRNAEHYERFTRKIDRECRKNYYRQDERIYTPTKRNTTTKNIAFKIKTIFIAIIIWLIAGWIITLLH